MARITLMIATLSAASLLCTSAADPDPVRDFPTTVNGSDFILRNITDPAHINNKGTGGTIYGANVKTFPQLSTQGLSSAYAVLKPGGEHLPHWHLRASELLFLIQGKLQVDWLDTAGNLYEFTLNPGDQVIIPRGVSHSLRNVGSEESVNFSAFNSENPGTAVLSTQLFSFPKAFQTNAFQTDLNKVANIDKAKVPGATPAIWPVPGQPGGGISIGVGIVGKRKLLNDISG